MSVSYKIGTDHQEKDNVVGWHGVFRETKRERENKGVPLFPTEYLTVSENSLHLK